MKRTVVLALLTLLPAFLAAKVNVVVSILPQKYFVEKIAGDLADVTVMVPPGASPATYEPKPSQMKALYKARLYFAIGVPFERAWLPRFLAQNPRLKMVDVTKGIEKMAMAGHHHEGDRESGSANGEAAVAHPDPHVWLAPPLVRTVARNIAEALIAVDGEHKTVYEKNLARFLREIDALDARLRKLLEPCRGKALMVFHPSWGYFAKTYGLRQIPIEIEGKEPKSRELAHLIREAKEEGVKALFVQPEFSRRAARAIAAAIGAKLLVADPLAADWSENLLHVARTICRKGE
ncbi:zinc ABC transporter substrate-binding protein [Hydrogenimonas sp. SS33]|uniref:metal ABC transporter solute-binding protein, Zn/Mn family n=1 Tax=Hydrogenimonas leucolamina TaxID=2954236 RepID=UPI00336BAF8B